jgi:hypothetical protein
VRNNLFWPLFTIVVVAVVIIVGVLIDQFG